MAFGVSAVTNCSFLCNYWLEQPVWATEENRNVLCQCSGVPDKHIRASLSESTSSWFWFLPLPSLPRFTLAKLLSHPPCPDLASSHHEAVGRQTPRTPSVCYAYSLAWPTLQFLTLRLWLHGHTYDFRYLGPQASLQPAQFSLFAKVGCADHGNVNHSPPHAGRIVGEASAAMSEVHQCAWAQATLPVASDRVWQGYRTLMGWLWLENSWWPCHSFLRTVPRTSLSPSSETDLQQGLMALPAPVFSHSCFPKYAL